MDEFNKAIEVNQAKIQSALRGMAPGVKSDVLKALSTVYNNYTDNLEELVEACIENRLIMLDVPRELQSISNIEPIEELMIDLMNEAMQIKSNESNKKDVAYVQVSEEEIDVPIESLIFEAMESGTLPVQEDKYIDLQETDINVSDRKPPVVLQTPAVESGLFNQPQDSTPQNNAPKQEPPKQEPPKQEQPRNNEILNIATLVVDKPITKYALCTSCEIATSPKSRWLEVMLKDSDGKIIVGRMFGYKLDYVGFKGKVVKISGMVNSYNNTINIKIDDISDENIPYKLDAFAKSIPDVKEYAKILQELITMIEDTTVKTMMVHIFKADNMLNHYATRASAVSYHGVLKGDLLKHTVNVTRSALYMAKINQLPVDKDVIIAAGILHDLGKVIELPPVGLTEYTIEGKLMGHTFISANYVYNKCKEFNVPQNKMLNIIHSILSHHGKLEFGAPVIPLTLEARLISDSDNLESQAIHINETLDNAKPYECVKDKGRVEYVKL